MKNRSYYKTDDPEVLRLLSIHADESRAIEKLAVAFSAEFGGVPLYINDLHGMQFAGLRFSPVQTDPMWTKPDPKRGRMQRPRASIVGASPEQRAALRELNQRWMAGYPKQKSDFAPVLKAMGTDWGACLFGGGGFAMFEHDGFVWVTTGVKLAPCMTEVLASVYLAARARLDAVKEDA